MPSDFGLGIDPLHQSKATAGNRRGTMNQETIVLSSNQRHTHFGFTAAQKGARPPIPRGALPPPAAGLCCCAQQLDTACAKPRPALSELRTSSSGVAAKGPPPGSSAMGADDAPPPVMLAVRDVRSFVVPHLSVASQPSGIGWCDWGLREG